MEGSIGVRASGERLASVIPLDERRRARASRRYRQAALRPLVAIWFGTAVFAIAVLVTGVVVFALRHAHVGVPLGVAVCAVAMWPVAGRWLASERVLPRVPFRRG